MVKQTLRDPYGSLGLRGDSVWIASERRCPIKSNPSQIGAPLIVALATAAAPPLPVQGLDNQPEGNAAATPRASGRVGKGGRRCARPSGALLSCLPLACQPPLEGEHGAVGRGQHAPAGGRGDGSCGACQAELPQGDGVAVAQVACGCAVTFAMTGTPGRFNGMAASAAWSFGCALAMSRE